MHNLDRGHCLYGGRPLLTAGSRAVSYAEFAGLVEGAAARLAAAGLRPGDRLAVCLPGGLDIAVAIWACARAGYIFAGLPTTLTPACQRALLTHADPALVLAGEAFLPGLRDSRYPVQPAGSSSPSMAPGCRPQTRPCRGTRCCPGAATGPSPVRARLSRLDWS